MRKKSQIVVAALGAVLLFSAPSFAEVRGFVEAAGAARFGDDRPSKDGYNLGETRLQLKADYFPDSLEDYGGEFFFKGDLVGDAYNEELVRKLRDLNLFVEPGPSADFKAGRQVLTWGTGDYLFINDLFPKDYISFFTGRDDEYLKLPSDALRLRLFSGGVTLDSVYIWDFEPSETVRGERFSYFDTLKGALSGADSSYEYVEPGGAEGALRLYGTVRRYEAAAYYFDGYYKEPRGVLDAAAGRFYYPPLRVYGASLRGPLAGGVASVEAGWYDSLDDRGGTRSDVENGALKYMAGYSKDLGGDLEAGGQFIVERMRDYGAYEENLPAGSLKREKYRTVATLRFAALFMEQTVRAGVFVFYSPSDGDYYLRPSVVYAATDSVTVALGGNVFVSGGGSDSSEFGQMKGNDNLYMRVRYGF